MENQWWWKKFYGRLEYVVTRHAHNVKHRIQTPGLLPVILRMHEKVIVVAKHSEYTEWCKGRNCVIVQKDIDLPNEGREASSYIWYIIKNYDNLPQNITFCQGNPFVHAPSLDCDFTDGIVSHGILLRCNKQGKPHHLSELDIEGFASQIGISVPDTLIFIMGAQFTVHKDLILKRPKNFYVKLYELANSFPNGPWILERLWIYIFA